MASEFKYQLAEINAVSRLLGYSIAEKDHFYNTARYDKYNQACDDAKEHRRKLDQLEKEFLEKYDNAEK